MLASGVCEAFDESGPFRGLRARNACCAMAAGDRHGRPRPRDFDGGGGAGRQARDPSADPVCSGPQDLYNSPARETLQRLLDDWLRRNRATPFDLLHRPDLVEKLEASGMEVPHAIQKISVPESQISGPP